MFAEHNLGSAHHRLGNLTEARSWYARSYRHHGNLQSLENLGHVLSDTGHPNDGSVIVRASDKLYGGEELTATEQQLVDKVSAESGD